MGGTCLNMLKTKALLTPPEYTPQKKAPLGVNARITLDTGLACP